MLAIFTTVACRACTEAGSRRGVSETRRRHQCLSSLKEFRSKGIQMLEVTRYVSIFMLREGRRNLRCELPKLGDPLHSSDHVSLFVPPTTAAVAVPRHLWPIGCRPEVLRHYGRPYIEQGGHHSPPSPVVGFILQGE